MTDPTQAETQRLDYIDALRGIAIIGVVIMHVGSACKNIGLPDWVYSITVFGERGVQLFFMLSAITLTSIYKERPFSKPSFFIKRFFRVAPMFYLAAVFYRLLDGNGSSEYAPDGIGLRQIILTITFLHGLSFDSINSVVPGGWSIANEALFYLLFPFLIAVLKSAKQAIAALFISIIIGKISQYAVFHIFTNNTHLNLISGYAHSFFPTQLPVFLMGFVAYFYINSVAQHPHDRYINTFIKITFIFSLTGLILCAILYQQFKIVDFWPVVFLYMPFVLGISHVYPKTIFYGLLRYMGKISYSIYIVHFFFVDHLVKSELLPALQNMHIRPTTTLATLILIGLTLSAAVATITYRLIEKPFIVYGHKIATKF